MLDFRLANPYKTISLLFDKGFTSAVLEKFDGYDDQAYSTLPVNGLYS